MLARSGVSNVARARPTGASLDDANRLRLFLAKVKLDPATGCWVWTASVNSSGYGIFGTGQKTGVAQYIHAVRTVVAHRWSYEAHNGPIPAGLTLDHRCRNRRCVAPHHLDVVTAAENAKRRHACAGGAQ